MADTITKSVAARVPMDTYIEIIKTAAELKMTISDYLIMKLFQESKSEQLQQDLAEKEKAISQIKSELAEIQKEKKKLEIVKANSAIGSKEKDTKVKEQATKITNLATENISLKAEIARLQKGNITSNASMNTSLNNLTTQLKQSEASLKITRKDLNDVMDKNTTLCLELNKVKKEVKDLSTQLAMKMKSGSEVCSILEAYNKEHKGLFGDVPVGDVTMNKIKKLLVV